MSAQFESSMIVRRAFHAAFLLTRNTLSAEWGDLCAIESLSPEDFNTEVWLTKTLEETIQRLGETAEHEKSGFADNLPDLTGRAEEGSTNGRQPSVLLCSSSSTGLS